MTRFYMIESMLLKCLAARSVQWTEGAAEGELSQNTVLLCLENQDPNAHKQGNVCERQQFTRSIKLSLRLVVHREGEKGRRGLCQEDRCSAICADFVFGLSRSRSQSPTTVLTINHDIRIESRSQYQRSSRGRQCSRREFEPMILLKFVLSCTKEHSLLATLQTRPSMIGFVHANLEKLSSLG